jgi:hypothetical protein
MRLVVPLLEDRADGERQISPRSRSILRDFSDVLSESGLRSEDWSSFFDDFIDGMATCGAVSAARDSSGLLLLASAVNRRGWVSIEATPSRHE